MGESQVPEELLELGVQTRRAIVAEIEKVYIGSAEVPELLFTALLSGGHALLEGVPGIAKTTLVKAFAASLGCAFKRVQFTPDLLPADITGTYVLNTRDNAFELRKGPIFSQIILGDEINRAPAKTQSALLEAMAEKQVTVEGQTLALEPPFMVLATQNPLEQEGVYPLPEAQLDRFTIMLKLGYPTFAHEQRILDTYDQTPPPVAAVTNPEALNRMVAAATSVFVEAGLRDYIVGLARYTRDHDQVLYGASPRASLTLLRASKCRAYLQGRAYVTVEDIRFLLGPIVAHRIQMTPEAELEGAAPDQILDDAVAHVRYAPQ